MVANYSEQHTYNRTSFNCVNYTNDVMLMANAMGYDVMRVKGCPLNITENNTCHAWVRWYVDIEPQHGSIAHNYSSKYPIQTITAINCDGCSTRSIPSMK